MKLVLAYIFTIILIIARDSHVDAGSLGFLAPEELEYLSKRLYPAECSYLTTVLSNSIRSDCKSPKQSSTDDSLSDRQELYCLFKLHEWNEKALKDDRAGEHLEKILHEIGRFDLAAHFSKTTTQHSQITVAASFSNTTSGNLF